MKKTSESTPLNDNEKSLLRSIISIDKELSKRKQKDKLISYNTGKIIHKKQIDFHKSLKRNRWVFGGNRTGKTECGAVEVVWMARGNHPYRLNRENTCGWVVSVSTKVQVNVAQEKILKYLRRDCIYDVIMSSGKKGTPEYGVIDTILVKNVFGGISKIVFKSCEEGWEKFQGASLDYVWFDEEPPREIYNECEMRVLDKCGDIFGTMTPLKGLTFVYDKIYLNVGQDPEIFYIFMEWEDNPYLSKEEIKRLTASLPKSELESRRYGRFLENSSGLVYKEFDENVHVIEPFEVPVVWYDKISIDPGLNNPLSAHWYAVDYDGNIYVIYEHYEAGRNVDYHADKIKEISAKLNWHTGFSGKIEALIDSAANQRTLASSKSVSELFYDQGILVNPNVNKDLFSGISKVKSYLKNANNETKLFIFKNCVNLIREIKGYWWGTGDAPEKEDDHALDDLRYYIMSRPENAKRDESKTVIQRDKEKLYRKIKNERKFR